MKITDVELSALGIDVHAVVKYLEDTGWAYSAASDGYNAPSSPGEFRANVRPYSATVGKLCLVVETIAMFENRDPMEVARSIVDE